MDTKFDVDNKCLLNISERMNVLLETLSHAFDTEIKVYTHKYYDDEKIEYIETDLAIFYISKIDENSYMLNIHINLDLHVNMVARLGLYISTLYEDIFIGFKFEEPFKIVSNKIGESKFIYGDEAELKKKEDIFYKEMHRYGSHKYLEEVDIDKIPSC